MARFRAVDPLAPATDRRPIRENEGGAMAVDRFRKDAWAMVHTGDVMEESSATSSHAVEASVKKVDEPEEPVAVPTPIGCWKVISPDGHEERVFRPIPGFEHLCNGPAKAQGVPRLADAPRAIPTPIYQTAMVQVPAAAKEVQPKKRKRTRSLARGTKQAAAQQHNGNDNGDQYDDRDVTVPTDKSYTFYIGNVYELEQFFRRRLDELTMKPVRPIVTAWVKQVEPKRLSRYGPYHKMLPKDKPEECTPPWWPRDVPYEEPSHLDKAGLMTLAVNIMLQHRNVDKAKRSNPRISWVAKLRQAAEYAVETTPPDQFSSSKGSSFSERMQGRALAEILPNLFETAQLYEDHLAKYNLYEGTNNIDPGIGTHVTWQPLTRPPRQPSAPRKRSRYAKATPPPRAEYDADASGNETEVDNTATESQLRREKKAQQPQALQQQVQAPVCGLAVSQPPYMYPLSSTTTPNTSFGQSMHSLRLDDNMDLDVKVANPTEYHNQPGSQSNFHCGQPMQCCTSHSNYGHVLQPQQAVGPCDVAPVSAPAYHQPFTMFDPTYHRQAEGSAFNNNTVFPYDYDVFAPSFFDGLPHMSSISGETEGSHH